MTALQNSLPKEKKMEKMDKIFEKLIFFNITKEQK